MRHTENGTNHEETSSGMNQFVDKQFKIVVRVLMHLRERLIQGRLFFRVMVGFYQSLNFSL